MIIKKCKHCNQVFRARKQINLYCSDICHRTHTAPLISASRKGQKKTEEHKENLRKAYYKKGSKCGFRPSRSFTRYPRITVNGVRKHIHRFAVEQFLKRELTTKEEVHHINGIKTDNRLKNLYLFPSHAEHIKYHLKKNINIKLTSNIIE